MSNGRGLGDPVSPTYARFIAATDGSCLKVCSSHSHRHSYSLLIPDSQRTRLKRRELICFRDCQVYPGRRRKEKMLFPIYKSQSLLFCFGPHTTTRLPALRRRIENRGRRPVALRKRLYLDASDDCDDECVMKTWMASYGCGQRAECRRFEPVSG